MIKEKQIYQIIEFLKPTWKKQILFFFCYFLLTVINVEDFKKGVLFLVLAYLLSCVVIKRVLKSTNKIKIWEITMFLGTAFGISFVYPFNLIWIELVGVSFEFINFISYFSVIIISPKYSNTWLYMISPVILFATLGTIIGWFIGWIFIFSKEIIKLFQRLFLNKRKRR